MTDGRMDTRTTNAKPYIKGHVAVRFHTQSRIHRKSDSNDNRLKLTGKRTDDGLLYVPLTLSVPNFRRNLSSAFFFFYLFFFFFSFFFS